MAFGKKKPSDHISTHTEEDIQKEIQCRILKESYRREGRINAEESTKATLDALEEIVSLTREEMEQIAEQVRAEFKTLEDPLPEMKGNRILPWLSVILIVATFLLVRRGSSWFLFTTLILVFVVLNYYFRKPPSE